MNCIVIDDDNMSRMLLEKFISRTDFLNKLESFNNALDAISYLNKRDDIDLIFLDIEMPEMTGIEFLQSLNSMPLTIVTSGKKDYAIDAFDHNVTDYVLKPLNYSRLLKAVDKAYKIYKEQQGSSNESDGDSDGIFIKTNASLVRVKYEEILWIEALENYIVINTHSEKHTIHFTMKAFINKLPETKFIRIHRSFIVNIDNINLIEDNSIIMESSTESKIIPIGKSYKENLMKQINLLNR